MRAQIACGRLLLLAAPLVALLVALLVPGGRALAWTDTRVEGASAHVEVRADTSLKVALVVRIHVRGGWLSRFELEGLGPDSLLDAYKPAYVVGEDGRKYLPRVSLPGKGRARLVFPHRRAAPRRGHYELGLFYTTGPSQPVRAVTPDRVALRWQLPAWEMGLENVDLWVTAPAGTSIHIDELLRVRRKVTETPTLSLHHLQRAQLPRTRAWQLALHVPRAALSEAALPASAPAPAGSASGPTREHVIGIMALGLLLGLSLLKQWLPMLPGPAGAAAPPQRCYLVPLGPSWLRTLATLMAAAVAALSLDTADGWTHAAFALPVLLSVARRHRKMRAPRCAALHPVPPGWLSLYRERKLVSWFSLDSWLDATRPCGAVLLACLWMAALGWTLAWTPQGTLDSSGSTVSGLLVAYSVLLASTLFVTDTRPNSEPGAASLLRLARLQKRLTARLPQVRATLLAAPHLDGTLHPEVRLRLSREMSADPGDGLVQLDCLIVAAQRNRRAPRKVALLALVEDGSPAHGRLLQALAGARCTARSARLTALQAICDDPLAALTGALQPTATREPPKRLGNAA